MVPKTWMNVERSAEVNTACFQLLNYACLHVCVCMHQSHELGHVIGNMLVVYPISCKQGGENQNASFAWMQEKTTILKTKCVQVDSSRKGSTCMYKTL